MGTIIIKNLSTLNDKVAARLAVDYWIGEDIAKEYCKEENFKVIRKGNTITVYDNEIYEDEDD